MGRSKYVQLTFHNAMNTMLTIDGKEISVRHCPEQVFSELVRQAIAGHKEQEALEKELAGLAYCHMADRWFTLNVMRRRSIKLTEER